MTATDNKLFFDSNVWLGYFLHSDEKLTPLVESPEGKLFTSLLSIHEVVKVLRRKNRNIAFIREAVRYMWETSTVVNVNEDIVVTAVEWCLKNKLSTVDSIIYQSALASGALLLTTDSDFNGLPNVFQVKV